MPVAASGVIRPRPVDAPDLRLFLLHHAGGSHRIFRPWIPLFPQDWEICLVEAPGRGRMARLPPAVRVEDLVDHLLAELDPWLDRPFAVFGHSMGGLAGLALTAVLCEQDRPPVWLGVSAHPGPRSADGPPKPRLHRLSSTRLRAVLAELGGVPDKVLADDAMWSVVEPLLRADLTLAETWQPDPAPVVPVPMTAFCGASDIAVPPEAIGCWARYTQRFLGVRIFPGGHFYLQDNQPEVVGQIVADVLSVLGSPTRTRRLNPAVMRSE